MTDYEERDQLSAGGGCGALKTACENGDNILWGKVDDMDTGGNKV